MRRLIVAFLTGVILFPGAVMAVTGYPSNFQLGLEMIQIGNWEEAFKSFQLVKTNGNNKLLSNTDFLKGYTLLKMDRLDEAKASFLNATGKPLVGDWALFHIAGIEAKRYNYEELVEVSEKLFVNFPFSPLYNRMVRYKAEGLVKTGRVEEAVVLLQNHVDIETDDKQYLLWDLAQNLEITGKSEKAYQTYQEIYYSYPHHPIAEEARKRTVRMQKEFPGGFKTARFSQKFNRVEILMEKSKYAEADIYITSIDSRKLKREERSRLKLKKAISLKKQGKTKEAIVLYRKIIYERPKTTERPVAMYLLSRIYWNMGMDIKARRLLAQLINDYPDHPKTAMAYYITARIAQGERRLTSAFKNYSLAVEKFKDELIAEDCLWETGWLYYELGEYEKAEESFNSFIEKYPQSDHLPKILYWQARNLEKQGKSGKEFYSRLTYEFSFSYYALSAPLNGKKPIYTKNPSVPANNHKLGKLAKQHIEKYVTPFRNGTQLNGKQKWFHDSARNWIEIGFKRRAIKLLNIMAEELPESTTNFLLISYLYHKSGDYESLIKNFWKAAGEKVKDEKARQLLTLLMFPVPYWEIIIKAAEKENVDPMLILSIIRQESSFNTDSVSPADARGLMQIIPSTGENISKALGMKNFNIKKLHEPGTNIKMGSFYLAYLIRDAGGNVVPAIASYNAGKYKVKKWFEKCSCENMEEFIEKIPYPETRGYVKNVLRNYGIYKKMYEQLTGIRVVSR